ncbi:MAG TPA: aminotransferase class I/II-fold pyridoxal phosphate-dependent enzyme [Candidatus Dormibacteraeota bacterium]|nr:aminotransferase class I/II-fold pyridoxal phosphate-dependent enzyme [Candidatus Dormibacteraeota bacterium]
MSFLRRVRAQLAQIDAQHRRRHVDPYPPAEAIDFSGNDYLALAHEPQVVEALRRANVVGSGGSRLLSGRHREHSLLEEELARWLGRERVLLFSSGYHAAIGTAPVIGELVDRIDSDERNHACWIDGMRLARAPRAIYAHARPPIGDGRARAIISETLFSMDGDAIEVGDYVRLLGAHDVLILDEAHALGVLGERGAGLARAFDDERILVMGTLSKSFGCFGGFIAGANDAVELLANRARSFIFDTALPPALALAARVSLALLGGELGDRRRAHLHELHAHLRAGLRSLRLEVAQEFSPIIPVQLGSEERALQVAAHLRASCIEAPAIRPPTVAIGASRLRLSLRADHRLEHIDLLVESLGKALA